MKQSKEEMIRNDKDIINANDMAFNDYSFEKYSIYFYLATDKDTLFDIPYVGKTNRIYDRVASHFSQILADGRKNCQQYFNSKNGTFKAFLLETGLTNEEVKVKEKEYILALETIYRDEQDIENYEHTRSKDVNCKNVPFNLYIDKQAKIQAIIDAWRDGWFADVFAEIEDFEKIKNAKNKDEIFKNIRYNFL